MPEVGLTIPKWICSKYKIVSKNATRNFLLYNWDECKTLACGEELLWMRKENPDNINAKRKGHGMDSGGSNSSHQ